MPGSDRIYNHSSEFWLYHRFSFQLGMPKRPLEGGALVVSWSDTWTTSTGSFLCEFGRALLRAPSGVSHPALSPATLMRNLISATWTLSVTTTSLKKVNHQLRLPLHSHCPQAPTMFKVFKSHPHLVPWQQGLSLLFLLSLSGKWQIMTCSKSSKSIALRVEKKIHFLSQLDNETGVLIR